MKKILDELQRVEKLFEELDNFNHHRDRNYSEDREWWILGKLKLIFDKEGISFPEYAEKLNEPDTDFNISYNGSNVFKGIQITELVPPEYSKKGRKQANLDVWERYEIVLTNKMKHSFGSNHWLLVYFDIKFSSISNYDYWHNVILERSREIALPKQYERIIVINSRAEAAVSLSPFLFVIWPEWLSDATIVDQCIYRKVSYYKQK